MAFFRTRPAADSRERLVGRRPSSSDSSLHTPPSAPRSAGARGRAPAAPATDSSSSSDGSLTPASGSSAAHSRPSTASATSAPSPVPRKDERPLWPFSLSFWRRSRRTAPPADPAGTRAGTGAGAGAGADTGSGPGSGAVSPDYSAASQTRRKPATASGYSTPTTYPHFAAAVPGPGPGYGRGPGPDLDNDDDVGRRHRRKSIRAELVEARSRSQSRPRTRAAESRKSPVSASQSQQQQLFNSRPASRVPLVALIPDNNAGSRNSLYWAAHPQQTSAAATAAASRAWSLSSHCLPEDLHSYNSNRRSRSIHALPSSPFEPDHFPAVPPIPLDFLHHSSSQYGSAGPHSNRASLAGAPGSSRYRPRSSASRGGTSVQSAPGSRRGSMTGAPVPAIHNAPPVPQIPESYSSSPAERPVSTYRADGPGPAIVTTGSPFSPHQQHLYQQYYQQSYQQPSGQPCGGRFDPAPMMQPMSPPQSTRQSFYQRPPTMYQNPALSSNPSFGSLGQQYQQQPMTAFEQIQQQQQLKQQRQSRYFSPTPGLAGGGSSRQSMHAPARSSGLAAMSPPARTAVLTMSEYNSLSGACSPPPALLLSSSSSSPSLSIRQRKSRKSVVAAEPLRAGGVGGSASPPEWPVEPEQGRRARQFRFQHMQKA